LVGGAIFILNYNVLISNCTFVLNSAKKGGAIFTYFGEKNEILIVNSIFKENVAAYSGAAIIWYQKHVTTENVTYIDNLAFTESESS